MAETDLLTRIFRLHNHNIAAIGRLYEAATEACYRHILKPGDHAIDHGSHTGRHCFHMASCVEPEGRVYAFEAINRLYVRTILEARARNITCIDFFNIAVSDRQRRVRFSEFSGNEALSGIEARRDLSDEIYDSQREIDLLAVPTDDIVPHYAPIRFIKSDIEGGELDALKGTRQIIARQRPVVVFENGRQKSASLYGYSSADFFSFFESLSYDLYDMAGIHFGPDRWEGIVLSWNYYAIPRERSDLPGLLSKFLLETLD